MFHLLVCWYILHTIVLLDMNIQLSLKWSIKWWIKILWNCLYKYIKFTSAIQKRPPPLWMSHWRVYLCLIHLECKNVFISWTFAQVFPKWNQPLPLGFHDHFTHPSPQNWYFIAVKQCWCLATGNVFLMVKRFCTNHLQNVNRQITERESVSPFY